MDKAFFWIGAFALCLLLILPDVIVSGEVEHYTQCNIYGGYDCVIYATRFLDVLDGNMHPETSLVLEEKASATSYLRTFNPLMFGMVFSFWDVFMEFPFALSFTIVVFALLSYTLLYLIGRELFDGYYSVAFAFLLVSGTLHMDSLLVLARWAYGLVPGFTTSVLGLVGRDASNLVVTSRLTFWSANLFKPALAFSVWSLGMWLYLRLRKFNLVQSALVGLVWGLMMYSYPFYALVFYAGLGVALLYALWKDTDHAVKLGCGMGVMVVSLVPYLIQMGKLKSMASYGDFLVRSGFELGRFIRWIPATYLSWILLIVALILVSKYVDRDWLVLLLGMIAGLFVTVNLQLLTGENPQPHHWVAIVAFWVVRFGWLTVLYVLLQKLYDSYDFKRVLPYAACLAAFFIGLGLVVAYSSENADTLQLPSEEVALYSWINNHVANEAVVVTDSLELNHHLPVYTAMNVYFPYGFNTFLSFDEMIERGVGVWYLLNYSPDEVRSLVENETTAELFGERTVEKRPFDTALLWHLKHYNTDTPDVNVLRGYAHKTVEFTPREVEKIVLAFEQMNSSKLHEHDLLVTERDLGKQEMYSSGKWRVYLS